MKLYQKALIRLKKALHEREVKSINRLNETTKIALITAALGLGSETGEFVEIVKKMFLQGKPPSDDNVFHMKRELGDIMWYWVTACAALDLDPFEVISENQKNLKQDMVSNSKLKEARLEKREIYSFQRNGASSKS